MLEYEGSFKWGGNIHFIFPFMLAAINFSFMLEFCNSKEKTLGLGLRVRVKIKIKVKG